MKVFFLRQKTAYEMSTAYGAEDRAIWPSFAGAAIEWIANRLRPIGGVSWPSSIITTSTTPNHTASNPIVLSVGYSSGTESSIIEMPATNWPSTGTGRNRGAGT